ncbi:hypothetical protein BST61_g1086 [Cercospora zeina]
MIRELITVRHYHFVVGLAILQDSEEAPISSVNPVYAGAFGAARLGLKCISYKSILAAECIPDLRSKGRRVS